MEKVKLSPPWDEFVHKLNMLFLQDDEIEISYNEDESKVKIFVDSADKYEALVRFMPTEKDFGGHKLTIDVVPADITEEEKNNSYYIRKLFLGNEAVSQIVDRKLSAADVTYVEFEKEVIQFWNDNLGDLHGLKSTLMEDIAREVFNNTEGVFFGTDVVSECECY